MTDRARTVLIDVAAQMIGCSRRTIYYAIADGRLRTARTPLGTQRVLVESIEALRPGMIRRQERWRRA